MRILYGVVGEGMGHATRSRVILDHLVQQHDVHVVVSGRAYEYLAQRVSDRLKVTKIWGLTIVYEDNEVQTFKTLLENVKGAFTGGWPENIRAYFDMLTEFQPDVVISDFESWSYLFGRNHRLPVFSIDNMQVINRCTHPDDVLEGHHKDFALTKAIVKSKLPGASHYFVSTFFQPAIRKPRTTLVPSVLRPEILAAKSERGEHLLVYQTSTSFEELPDILARTGLECRVYGLRRDLKEEVVEGKIHYRPFSEQGFVDDLRTARAVLAGGGFTLMSESIYHHKPMLSVPVGGQFEQVLNARYLQHAGFGVCAEELTSQTIFGFLERLDDLQRNLGHYRQDGNNELFSKLDLALQQVRDGQAAPGWDLDDD